MAVKRVNKESKLPLVTWGGGIGKALTPEQDLFCRLYGGSEFFGNGTLAYVHAYGFELDGKSDKEKKRALGVAATNASRLLLNAHIKARVHEIARAYITDDEVDFEIAKVIKQDVELPAKVAAAKEFNRVRGRVVEKVDVRMLLLNMVEKAHAKAKRNQKESKE